MTERATKPAEEASEAARAARATGDDVSRPPAGARLGTTGLAAGQVLAFQRSVGNAAVAGSLTGSRPPSRPAPSRSVARPVGGAAQAFLQRETPRQGGSAVASGLAEETMPAEDSADGDITAAQLQAVQREAAPSGAGGGGGEGGAAQGDAAQGAGGGGWWEQLSEFGELAARLGGKASEVWNKLGPFTATLWAGVKGGFSGFVSHFSEHFQTQFQGWFGNTMGAAGFQAPQTWDLHGFFTMVFSVLGINLDSVQSRFAEIDQEGIDGVPELKALHEKGPIALVELAEGELNTIQEEVVEDVKSNLVTSLVTQGVEFLLGMLAPAAGGVMALIRILRYFWDNRQAFKDLGNRLVSSVDSILGGKVEAVEHVVEGSLAATIPLLLSLFERLLKLDKLAEKVAGIIGKVRGSITGLIDKVVGRAKEAGRRLMGGRKAGKAPAAGAGHPAETTHASEATHPAAGAPATGPGNQQTKPSSKHAPIHETESVPFQLDGQAHHVIAEYTEGQAVKVAVASEEHDVDEAAKEMWASPEAARQIKAKRALATKRLKELDAKQAAQKDEKGDAKIREEIQKLLHGLAEIEELLLPTTVEKRRQAFAIYYEALPDKRNELYERDSDWKNARQRVWLRDMPTIRARMFLPLDKWVMKGGDKERVVEEWVKLSHDVDDASADPDNLKLMPKAVILEFRAGQASNSEERSALADSLKRTFETTSSWQVDHILETATHWNTKGSNQSNEERTRWYVDMDNLQLVSARWNASNEAKVKFVSKPGPNFFPRGFKPLK